MLYTLANRVWHGTLFHFKKKFLKIRSHQDAYSVMNSFWKYKCDNEVEYSILLTLNVLNQVDSIIIHNVGNKKYVEIDTYKVIEYLKDRNKRQFYMAHNHPKNRLSPSKEDIHTTNYLFSWTEFFGIELLGHMILTDQSYHII